MKPDFGRKFPRRHFNRSSTILYRGRTLNVTTYEIGEGGVGLFTTEEVPEGQNAVINLFIGANHFGSINGNIVFQHSNANTGKGYTLGFKFLNLSFEMKRHIREFVAVNRQ